MRSVRFLRIAILFPIPAQKAIVILLATQTMALFNQHIYFQCRQIHIRVHCTGDLLQLIAAADIFQNFLILQGHLRSKNVRFIFHVAFSVVKFIKAARPHGFFSVQNVVSDLVKQDNVFQHRIQVVFDKNKTIAQQDPIGPSLPSEGYRDNFNAKRMSDPVRLSCAKRIDQFIRFLYDFQSLNTQNQIPLLLLLTISFFHKLPAGGSAQAHYGTH